MATLDDICEALPDVLSTVDGIEVYEFVPDVAVVPAVVVWPQEGEWVSMGRGIDRHEIDLYVLAPRPVPDEGQITLRQLMHEIRVAVWSNKTLGLDSTNAHVANYSRYGGNFEVAQVPHIGAVLRLVVHTSGT